jgi:hypothetical protein
MDLKHKANQDNERVIFINAKIAVTFELAPSRQCYLLSGESGCKMVLAIYIILSGGVKQ